MPHSLLLIPAPAADWLVSGRTEDPVALALGAHLPLLGPFAPLEELTDGVQTQLAELFADVVPFDYRLDAVCRFPTGATYLAPEPSGPFRHLTHALVRGFPEFAPEGRFDDAVPHVPVPLPDGESLADLERLVERHGPLAGRADTARLVWVDRSVQLVAEFAFGTTAA